MPTYKIIVNPYAGRGYASKVAPIVHDVFKSLGAQFEMVQTTSAGEAIDLTQRALQEGADTIVAVGGDGTTHEVMNGIMLHTNGHVSGPAGTLACIPAGSGNDFAMMNGMPADIEEACRLIVAGHTRIIDVGEVSIDGEIKRYFDNVVGVGFDGMVNLETKKYRHLRGIWLYLPVVLKTTLFSLKPVHATIVWDGHVIQQDILMTTVSNGPREGGGFFIAPGASCHDGELDLLIAASLPRLQVLRMIPHFMRGTHLQKPGVSLRRVRHVEISSEDPLYIHVDGEALCEVAHHVEARVIAGALRMIVPARPHEDESDALSTG